MITGRFMPQDIDLAILDIAMPRPTGIQAARGDLAARAARPHPDAVDV
jgi:CheY-like chemotaxis protein